MCSRHDATHLLLHRCGVAACRVTGTSIVRRRAAAIPSTAWGSVVRCQPLHTAAPPPSTGQPSRSPAVPACSASTAAVSRPLHPPPLPPPLSSRSSQSAAGKPGRDATPAGRTSCPPPPPSTPASADHRSLLRQEECGGQKGPHPQTSSILFPPRSFAFLLAEAQSQSVERYLRAIPATCLTGRESNPSHSLARTAPLDLSAFTQAMGPLRQFALHLVHAIFVDVLPLLLRRSYQGGHPYAGIEVEAIRANTRWDRRHGSQLGDLAEVVEAFEHVFFRIEREVHTTAASPSPAVKHEERSLSSSTAASNISRVFAYTNTIQPHVLYAKLLTRLFPASMGIHLAQWTPSISPPGGSTTSPATSSSSFLCLSAASASQTTAAATETFLPIGFPMGFIGEALGWGRFFATLCGPLPRLLQHCGREVHKATVLPMRCVSSRHTHTPLSFSRSSNHSTPAPDGGVWGVRLSFRVVSQDTCSATRSSDMRECLALSGSVTEDVCWLRAMEQLGWHTTTGKPIPAPLPPLNEHEHWYPVALHQVLHAYLAEVHALTTVNHGTTNARTTKTSERGPQTRRDSAPEQPNTFEIVWEKSSFYFQGKRLQKDPDGRSPHATSRSTATPTTSGGPGDLHLSTGTRVPTKVPKKKSKQKASEKLSSTAHEADPPFADPRKVEAWWRSHPHETIAALPLVLAAYLLHRFPLHLRLFPAPQPDPAAPGVAFCLCVKGVTCSGREDVDAGVVGPPRFASCPVAPFILPYLPSERTREAEADESDTARGGGTALCFSRLHGDMLRWREWSCFTASEAASMRSTVLSDEPVRWAPHLYYHPALRALLPSAAFSTAPMSSVEGGGVACWGPQTPLSVNIQQTLSSSKDKGGVSAPLPVHRTSVSLLSVLWYYTAPCPPPGRECTVRECWRASVDGLKIRCEALLNAPATLTPEDDVDVESSLMPMENERVHVWLSRHPLLSHSRDLARHNTSGALLETASEDTMAATPLSEEKSVSEAALPVSVMEAIRLVGTMGDG